MKIRSITYFLNPEWPVNASKMRLAGEFLSAARAVFEGAGYEVQTTRLAAIPFPLLIPHLDVGAVIQYAQALESSARASGIEYLAIGPALPHLEDSYHLIPDVLAATQNVFASGLMTTPDGGVSIPAVRACAGVIHRVARLSPDGFTNLRFGALANIPPGGPFLPSAYHSGEQPAFALALESADLAVQAFDGAPDLETGRQRLVRSVEAHAANLENLSQALAERYKIDFSGLDFTLAPFPLPELSYGAAMERLGLPAVGLHGSLSAAAILTDTLDRARFRRTGFNGLMLPVLEDAILAQRAAEGRLTVKDLLLYSAVCGTGLDTVPLPGDVSEGQLNAVLLDVASLSMRLNKPLIARLMPLPGKQAGDPTNFDFAYFANSRVLALEAEPLGGLLASATAFSLQARPNPGWLSRLG